MLPSLQTIREKRKALLAQAAHHDVLAKKARAEAADYDAAERVWLREFGERAIQDENQLIQRLSELGPETTEDIVANGLTDEPRDDIAPNGETQGKPVGTPPVPDMIIECLKEAAANGHPNIDPALMLNFVQQRYWPGARSADVGSTAWRMWKAGRLVKPFPNRPLYALPEKVGDNIF